MLRKFAAALLATSLIAGSAIAAQPSGNTGRIAFPSPGRGEGDGRGDRGEGSAPEGPRRSRSWRSTATGTRWSRC